VNWGRNADGDLDFNEKGKKRKTKPKAAVLKGGATKAKATKKTKKAKATASEGGRYKDKIKSTICH
jgi:hypothetical protein